MLKIFLLKITDSARFCGSAFGALPNQTSPCRRRYKDAPHGTWLHVSQKRSVAPNHPDYCMKHRELSVSPELIRCQEVEMPSRSNSFLIV
jgi:hypothetical protein